MVPNQGVHRMHLACDEVNTGGLFHPYVLQYFQADLHQRPFLSLLLFSEDFGNTR
jgi:hypothetical protein